MRIGKKLDKANPVEDLFESERDIDAEEDQVDIPFDPANVDIADMVYSVASLLDRLRHGDLNLTPDFQRRASLWDDVKKSRLIESILLRIPLPSFYFSEDNLGNFEVVDGLQRLCAIFHFVDCDLLNVATSSNLAPLRLSGLQYLSASNGLLFSDLDRQFQRRILELQIHVNLIRATTPREVMFNVFARLNQNAVPLTAQEIRNAIYPGVWRERTRAMAESADFIVATRNKVPVIRQQDTELVLRFVALWALGTPFRRPPNQVLDVFLNETVQSRLPAFSESDWVTTEEAFYRGLRGAVAIFGNDAFRSRVDGEVGGRLNRGLFEAKMIAIAELSSEKIKLLIGRRESVRRSFAEMFSNDKFVSSLRANTGSPDSSNTRIFTLREVFQEVINAY